jgi:arylsulfatase A-like enzyme
MSVADGQVGRLIEAYQRAGLFERTLWVVLSDHGMTPNSVNILPTYVDKVLSDADIQRIGGDTAHYWLKDQNENKIAAELIDAHDAEGFVGTYYKVEQANGHFVYEPTKVVERHLTGRMRSAIEFLHDTFACPQGPDLALVLAESAHFQNKPLNTAGSHSEATWELQKIPIWFSGPGVRSGLVSAYPARIVDIAPTILSLLGLPVPREMDGAVLQDVLASSSQQERDAQLASPETQRIIRHQDLLIEMSSLGRKIDQA